MIDHENKRKEREIEKIFKCELRCEREVMDKIAENGLVGTLKNLEEVCQSGPVPVEDGKDASIVMRKALMRYGLKNLRIC